MDGSHLMVTGISEYSIVSIPAPIKTRTARVGDAYFWRHFRHVPEFQARQQGVPWQVEYVTLAITDLFCPYPTPGADAAPPTGLMGSVGWPAGSAAGKRITEMAAAIQDAMRRHTADRENPALQNVLDLCDRGIAFILSREQPLAFMIHNGAWFVREGVHRAVAVALTGARELQGVNLSSVRQVGE